MNYVSFIFYTLISLSVRRPQLRCFIHLFICFLFYTYPKGRMKTLCWWGYWVKHYSSCKALSASSVASNQWEKWKASWERLGAERLCDGEYTGRTPTTNSCMFSCPKTHYLFFRASPIVCQIPIGIWHIDAQLTPTLFIQYNLSWMTYCLSTQCLYDRHHLWVFYIFI